MIRRRALLNPVGGGNIPAGYTPLRYIECNKHHFIHTGIHTVGIEQFKFQYVLNPNVYANTLLGFLNVPTSQSVQNTQLFVDGYWLSNGNLGIDAPPYDGALLYSRVVTGVPVELTLNQDGTAYYDSTALSNALVSQFFDKEYELALFEQTYWDPQGHGSMKLYHWWIDGEERFLCMLDPNGRPCLYDTVTQIPHYNSGTGEFGYETLDGTYVQPV